MYIPHRFLKLGGVQPEFCQGEKWIFFRLGEDGLHLIAENDPRSVASQTGLPVFGLSGWLDPIVPWPWVRRWLRKNCPALRDYIILPHADHNVLSTAPKEAAAQVLRWIEDL